MANSELKACPFCGGTPAANASDTFATCFNKKCPIYSLAMSFKEWNTRADKGDHIADASKLVDHKHETGEGARTAYEAIAAREGLSLRDSNGGRDNGYFDGYTNWGWVCWRKAIEWASYQRLGVKS